MEVPLITPLNNQMEDRLTMHIVTRMIKKLMMLFTASLDQFPSDMPVENGSTPYQPYLTSPWDMEVSPSNPHIQC